MLVTDSLDVVAGPRLVHKDAASQRFARQHLGEQHRQVALTAAQVDDGHRVATRWLSAHIVAHRRNDGRGFYDLLDESLGTEKAAPKGLVAAVAPPPCHHALYQIGKDVPVNSGPGRLCQLCLQPCSEGCIRRSLQRQSTGEGCTLRRLQRRRTDGTGWQAQRHHKGMRREQRHAERRRRSCANLGVSYASRGRSSPSPARRHRVGDKMRTGRRAAPHREKAGTNRG